MENKEKNFASAIIYVYNAEDRIKAFLEAIIRTMENNFEHSEIICVNDSSDDNSLEVIKDVSASASSTSISVVNMSYFHGLEVAMNAGMDIAIGDFVFEFDNTVLDFDESEIMNVYRRSLQGYDIVSAVPDKREKMSSKLFYKVFDKFTPIPYDMHTESFRILSRRVINRTNDMNKTVPYRKAVYANCGLKTDYIKYSVKQVSDSPICRREKEYRKKLAADSLLLFTEVGSKLSVAMMAVMVAIMLITIVYTIIAYIFSNPVSGWTSTILFLSVAFLGLFGLLSIIIKYLQLLVDLTFKRKHYSFESIIKLTK